jgi:hypothetical protein
MFRAALRLTYPSISIALLLACGSSEPGPRSPGGIGGGGGTSPDFIAAGSGGQTGIAGSDSGGAGGAGTPNKAGIQMRVASTAAVGAGGQRLLAFSGGGAVRPGLESLEYFIRSVQICETMTASGSGFSNPGGCLELYRGDESQLTYGLDGDWRPLANAARGMTTGFVDLLDANARETLNATTELTSAHVRSYNYGIITWSLPIKVKATIPLADGTFLYTHDGTTDYETLGVDNYRHYFTAPASSLATPPAEKAVVLLPNGGNWFKFQNPLVVTSADIEERRQWVLDLVFNPEGIVKGYAGDGISQGNLQERDGSGNVARVINVPMLDLAPIPHRQDEHVVRESYLGSVVVGPHAFDLRLELYSVESDPSRTVYGVDCKTLVTDASTTVPPDMSKVSYVVTEPDDSLTFQSFNHSPIISGFEPVAEEFGTTVASIKCAQHDNRAGAEGGAAIVVDTCPSADLDVTFRLVGRRRLDGELPSLPGPGDAGTDAAAPNDGDAGTAADAAADSGP